MPIYEYECLKCGGVWEVMQKRDDPPPAKHDGCGSKKVRRVMSASAFILKGDGWYVTDYPSAARKKGLESEKGGQTPASSDKSAGDKPAGGDKSGSASTATTASPSATASSSKAAPAD